MQQDMPLSDAIVYRSEVVVNLAPGAIKMVQLPAEANGVPMGLHGPIAAHYRLSGSAFIPHATTLDYVVGAIVACLTGSLSRALSERKIATTRGRLKVHGTGEIEAEDGVLVIKRIQFAALLQAEPDQKNDAEEVIVAYAMNCPLYRTLYRSIEISSQLHFQAGAIAGS
jgi:uncharacterized OsmC-like protein